ncbi:hypothetical protein O6H91_11G059000 [Diphasiastrum complanatum]|uniref:Uncharacterized protein n=1 Tax=Diphasiastrum complanatum TaxID=34168 RepID=A0ACC2C9I8_DIPCM|nr:hypothetical protein O6H91_11G059000 [Diphasiastrum complanatum]
MARADDEASQSLHNAGEGPEDPQLRQGSTSEADSLSHESIRAEDGKVGSSDASSALSEGSAVGEDGVAAGDKGVEEEEEAECPFCLFMKSGPCGEEFTNWEKCVEDAEKDEEDIVTKCWPVTQLLKKCMESNTDYYGVILQAEQAMEEQAALSEQASAAKSNEDSGEESLSQDSLKETDSKHSKEDQAQSKD